MLEIEYDDSALLESLVEDIREFTDGMEVSEGKGEYSIRKVRDSIRHSHLLRADLRGHCLELTVDEWPVHMFLREGILQVGWDEIHLQTSDMAVAAMNYLEGILPEYVSWFRELKDKSSLEEARIKQLNRICETAVMPLLGPLAAKASMTCTVRARNDSVSIVLKDRKGKSRSFRIGFERPILESLGPAKEYLQSMIGKRAGLINNALYDK